MEPSDYTLVQEILYNPQCDFTLIFTKYKNLVLYEAKKFYHDVCDVEDICEEVFLRVFKSLKLFKPEYRLSTWIVTITKNLCINSIRKKKNSFEGLELLRRDLYCVENLAVPEKIVLLKESSVYVRSVIYALPEIYRLPIFLFYYEDLSYQEISSRLNLPMSIVKNRIFRAKKLLKIKLSGILSE